MEIDPVKLAVVIGATIVSVALILKEQPQMAMTIFIGIMGYAFGYVHGVFAMRLKRLGEN